MLLLSGATKGLLGVGLPIVAVPMLILFLPLQTAIALMTVPLIATNIGQALIGKERPQAVLAGTWSIMATMVAGVAVGIWMLAVIEPARAKQILGVMMIVVAATMLKAPTLRFPDAPRAYTDPIAGLVCGTLGGLVGQAGTPMFIYLLLRGTTKDLFVQTASMFVALSQITIAILLGRSGLVEPETFIL